MSETLSNALADLAERIRGVSASADEAHKVATEKMIEAGHMLLEAKDACPHGQWAGFLERTGIDERKAQRYMKLARSGLKSDTVSEMGGLKAALDYIAQREYAPEPADSENPDIEEGRRLAAKVYDATLAEEAVDALISGAREFLKGFDQPDWGFQRHVLDQAGMTDRDVLIWRRRLERSQAFRAHAFAAVLAVFWGGMS